MIGCTKDQSVSGTRCATGFVELPSILMKHFLTSSRVLALFCTSTERATAANVVANNQLEDPCHNIDTCRTDLARCARRTIRGAARESSFDSAASGST